LASTLVTFSIDFVLYVEIGAGTGGLYILLYLRYRSFRPFRWSSDF